jgi:hypothetical protein
LSPFHRTFAFPSGVRAPVLRNAFARLALRRAALGLNFVPTMGLGIVDLRRCQCVRFARDRPSGRIRRPADPLSWRSITHDAGTGLRIRGFFSRLSNTFPLVGWRLIGAIGLGFEEPAGNPMSPVQSAISGMGSLGFN